MVHQATRDIPTKFREFFFVFVLNLVFLSRYMQPVGLWQRQHAAAPRKQETAALFPSTGIPLSYPRTSLRSYSGGLTTSPSPQFRQKALP